MAHAVRREGALAEPDPAAVEAGLARAYGPLGRPGGRRCRRSARRSTRPCGTMSASCATRPASPGRSPPSTGSPTRSPGPASPTATAATTLTWMDRLNLENLVLVCRRSPGGARPHRQPRRAFPRGFPRGLGSRDLALHVVRQARRGPRPRDGARALHPCAAGRLPPRRGRLRGLEPCRPCAAPTSWPGRWSALGVTRIFTLSGNHIMPIFDALLETRIALVHVRQEAACVHMADAWGRLTGEVGVALVTGGQGHDQRRGGALHGARGGIARPAALRPCRPVGDSGAAPSRNWPRPTSPGR